MKLHLKGAAKRLTFSLVAATALSGCAVYELGYPGYATSDPYAYETPVYPAVPYYVGPPVSLGLWYGSYGGGYRGYHGHHGHHGYHGHHGGFHGGGGGRH